MMLEDLKNSKFDRYLDANGLDSNGYSAEFLEEVEQVFRGPHQEMTDDDWDDLLGD